MNKLSDERCDTKANGVPEDYNHHLKFVANHYKVPVPPLTYKPYTPLPQSNPPKRH